MEMPISEIIDRYTVARVKMSKSPDKDEYKKQLEDYSIAVENLLLP